MIRADTSPLAPYRWNHRVVIVLAGSHDHALAARQQRALADEREGLIERDMVVVSVVGDLVQVDGVGTDRIGAADLRRVIDAATAAFGVVLVGKDGGVKLRADEPVAAERLFALIDTMPMRRQEMRTQTDRSE